MNEDEDRQKRDRREDELRRTPPIEIDKTQWPANVREITIKETSGLGVDESGRLHWNGKPVEIIGQRLDLTWAQFIIAVVVAVATVIAALATSVQALTAYSDWTCKVGWPSKCSLRSARPTQGTSG